MEENDIVRDSAIQRFEFTYDIFWKMLKSFLEEKHGVHCVSPKTCFMEAGTKGVLSSEVWIKITDLRNQTVHTYDEKIAKSVYQKLPEILIEFKKMSDVVG